MIACSGEADVEPRDVQPSTHRESAEPITAVLEPHIHGFFGVIAHAHPKVVRGNEVDAEDEVLGQRGDEAIVYVALRERLVDVLELPLIELHARNR